MDKLIQEIETEIQKTRQAFGMLDHYIGNYEVEIAEIKVGLANNDKAVIENMLESDNSYHAGFGHHTDYWTMQQEKLNEHIDTLTHKFRALALMLRKKYDIQKSDEESEHQPDVCDCLLEIEIDDIVVRDSFHDSFHMKRQETPVSIRDKDGEWTRTKPDTGLKIVKTTEFFLSDDEIKRIIDFNKSKDEKLECNEQGTMFGSKAPEGGVRLITGSAGGTDGIIEISYRVLAILEKMYRDSY
jgi:hypothetical protein